MTQGNSGKRRRRPVRSPEAGPVGVQTVGASGVLANAERCARTLIDFANRKIRKADFNAQTPPGGPADWLAYVRPIKPVTKLLPPGGKLTLPTPREVWTLQREVRAALVCIAGGEELRPLILKINREGQYRYGLDWWPPPGEKFRVGPVKSNWRIWWGPSYPADPRQTVLWAIGETLTVAQRVGRCDACQQFFFRAKRQRQRFCSGMCSTAFHNKRRLESGYFAERRRRRRAAVR